MLSDKINVKGQLYIKKYDSENNLVEERSFNNLVVTKGKQLIASRLFNNTFTTPISISSFSAPAFSDSVTIVFSSAQPIAPFSPGQYITLVDFADGVMNGTFRVTSCTVAQAVVEVNNFVDPPVHGASGVIAELDNGLISTMYLGTAATSPNLSDIDLVEKVTEETSSVTSQLSVDNNDSSIIYIGLFNSKATSRVIQEAGLYTTSGRLVCRTVFSPITKSNTESLEVFWKLTIA